MPNGEREREKERNSEDRYDTLYYPTIFQKTVDARRGYTLWTQH